MDNENEYAQEEVVEQEEQTSEDIINEEVEEEALEPEEDKVTLSKSEFNKLNRRAIAYETIKKEKPLSKPNQEASYISTERLDRIELMQEGYSKQEVDTIMELGGRKVLDNPIVQGAIKTLRQQEKSKDASTSLSSKSPVYKKYTQEDLNKLSAAEMEKLLRN